MALSGADKAFIQDAVRDLIVNDDAVAVELKRKPWQYTGGGLQGAVSTLDALSDSQNIAKAVSDLTALVVQQSGQSAEAIAQALAPLILAGMPETGLTADEVEARIRKVFGDAGDASA